MPLSSGDILSGHYRIEAEIGRGAYGRVYRARDTRLDRPVAIKELAKGVDELGSSIFSDYVRRFEREARVQAGFNHPNIVHVYELIQESADRLYLVMELVDGESLRDLLQRRGQLPIDEAVRITADILAGLAVVHADPRDIVHRDIKPSNVLLTKAGQAKLTDFGLAQVGDESMRSGAGQPHPGTPAYMSPEQETTSAYLYPASDLFSIGCVLFEMLTGTPYKRAKKERKGLAELRTDASPWLVELVTAALVKDPDERPKDGAEMGRLLAEARGKVDAEIKAEEQARQATKRKADEETERIRHAEQERQRQDAAERARITAAQQAQAEAARKQREHEEAEQARREAERKAQTEAEAARRARQEQEQREAAERAQQESETRAAARRQAVPWIVGVIFVAALAWGAWWLWQPREGKKIMFGAAYAITPPPNLTETRTPVPAREPTEIPAAPVAPMPTVPPAAAVPATASPVPPVVTPEPATQTPIPFPSFTVKEGSAVNVRSGPGTNYDIIGQLAAGSQHAVTGRTVANDWWQFDYNGKPAWVSDGVVNANSQATDAPAVRALPTPTSRPIARTLTGRIAFVSTRDGTTGEIYVMDADGSNQIRLTNNQSHDGDPAWSPDGKKITFVSARDGNYEIYAMNADGSSQTRLTNNPAEDVKPAWSPDGKRIAFQSNRDGQWDIYIMNTDGSNQARLTTGFGMSPAWSPDGKRIVFVCGQICVMNSDGNQVTSLTEGLNSPDSPAWSPSGTRIAFESLVNSGTYVINVVTLQDRRVTQITNGYDRNATWSPDETMIAFDSSRGSNMDVCTAHADGSGGVTCLTNSAAMDGWPVWSP